MTICTFFSFFDMTLQKT